MKTLREDTREDLERAALLCGGVKSILRCDEAEVVEGIARYVMSQHGVLRAGSALMERTRGTPLPPAAAVLGALTRFLEVRPGEVRDGAAVWVARLDNERGAVAPLPALLPELEWSELKFRFVPEVAGVSAAAGGFLRRWRGTYRLARRLHRRHEFFKVLRAVELVGYYARYLDIFRRAHFRLAVMSSHSNPHGIAFNLAARKAGVPVVLVTHGMPVRPVARLAYDLSVVHCEAARQTYLDEGCRLGRVLIHGRRGQHAPMPEGLPGGRVSVGLFLCKDVNEGRLRALAERLLGDPRVSRVVVRPHPKNLWRGLDEWITSKGEPRLSRSGDAAVFDDLKDTDFVLAGNSSVLVEALTAGRPAAYVPGIDHGTHDLHSFVARGLVYQFEDERGFDPDGMLRFYRRPEWPGALRLFANVDEDEAAVAAHFKDALRGLVSPAAAPVS